MWNKTAIKLKNNSDVDIVLFQFNFRFISHVQAAWIEHSNTSSRQVITTRILAINVAS